MKFLAEKHLIEILDATGEDVEHAAQFLGRKFSDMPHIPGGWIQDGIAKGRYQAMKMAVDGVDRFLVVYHVNGQSSLVVNAAAQMTPDYSNFDAFMAGLKDFARQIGCKAVEGITLRAGMFKELLRHGWKPIGVSLVCEI